MLDEKVSNNGGSGDEVEKKSGEFFTVNLSKLDEMVRADAGAEDVMAYLVLARGCGKNSTTFHGANSIANRIGITNYKAKQSLDWLTEHGYILKIKGVDEKKGGDRWQVLDSKGVDDIALPNSLTDGLEKGTPPLNRIYNELGMGKHCHIPDGRLDTIMVLLHLYKHHLLADCGGINPRSGLYRSWVGANNFNGEQVVNLEGTNMALYEIRGGISCKNEDFALEAIFYEPDNAEREIRFLDAFENLNNLGLMYEVIQVWSGNPAADKKAEPLYTLYINDWDGSNSDPYLSKVIHELAMRFGIMDAFTEFSHLSSGKERLDSASIGSGRFRYIANKKVGGFPIGIYRLRFRPNTRDTGTGIDAERKRVEKWSLKLNAI